MEQADYAAAKDLFGGAPEVGGINLDVFLPKSVKDFEDFAAALAARFVLPHRESKNYKMLVKTLAKKVWAGFLTAVTSSAAVKDEKNIAVTVVTGILLSVGATAGLVTLVTQVIQGL